VQAKGPPPPQQEAEQPAVRVPQIHFATAAIASPEKPSKPKLERGARVVDLLREVLTKHKPEWKNGIPSRDVLPNREFLKQAVPVLKRDPRTANLNAAQIRKSLLRAAGREH
jgi:hypothetical protein